MIPGLRAALAGTAVYAAHVAVAAYTGRGRPAFEPAAIADARWAPRTDRSRAGPFHGELPGGFAGLAGRFAA